eukprot:Mrub_03409.p2 GENE.Mrub_03409~~Mrub_03409.p2  ORF type:complete len:165 (+),score=45.47 Mrub_03409:883-1377(+)
MLFIRELEISNYYKLSMEDSKLCSDKYLVEKLKEVWKEVDIDGSGSLDTIELLTFMELIGFNGIGIELLMEVADENGDGNMDFGEMCDLLGIKCDREDWPECEEDEEDNEDDISRYPSTFSNLFSRGPSLESFKQSLKSKFASAQASRDNLIGNNNIKSNENLV